MIAITRTVLNRAIFSAGALLALTPAYAQTHGKPGLWETTAKIDMGAAMPQIPPDVAARMKQMGMQVPDFSKPQVVQACVTPEQAAQDVPPKINNSESGCTLQNIKRSGSSFSADQVCDGQFKGKGTVNMNYVSDTQFSGSSHTVGTANGHPMDMTTNFSGRWLGADCGLIKPVGQ